MLKKIIDDVKHIFRAFKYSWQGLVYVFKNEIAFRQDVLFFLICSVISFLLPVSSVSRAIMIFSLFFILLMEMVNTAIEVVINRISTERHPLSGVAKDIGSALVLLAFLNAIIVWLFILI
ncbi:MAG: diacylglycerol kinase [Alphaproteobacteria bacterium]|nr:diacylglycerol kinase [Alphaproteobacteria bacterium]